MTLERVAEQQIVVDFYVDQLRRGTELATYPFVLPTTSQWQISVLLACEMGGSVILWGDFHSECRESCVAAGVSLSSPQRLR